MQIVAMCEPLLYLSSKFHNNSLEYFILAMANAYEHNRCQLRGHTSKFSRMILAGAGIINTAALAHITFLEVLCGSRRFWQVVLCGSRRFWQFVLCGSRRFWQVVLCGSRGVLAGCSLRQSELASLR